MQQPVAPAPLDPNLSAALAPAREIFLWKYGAQGHMTQLGLVDEALKRADNREMLACAAGLLWWAWQCHPLSPQCVRLLRLLDAKAPFLPGRTRELVAALDATCTGMGVAEPAETDPDSHDALFRLVSGPGGAVHLGGVWQDVLLAGEPEAARELLEAAEWPAELALVRPRLEAEIAFALHAPERAMDAVAELDAEAFGWWRNYHLAELALRRGERRQGLDLLLGLWPSIPWHADLTRKLAALLEPGPAPAADCRDTAVCIYTWNKADPLLVTLTSLASSELGGAPVVVLDNGSSDETPRVLERARRDLFADRPFHCERLPVNIGAPAARNWLLELDPVRGADHAAFLDDDVLLPPDWLRLMLAEAREHDDYGALGCTVTEATPPFAVQSAGFHLLLPEMGPASFHDVEENIHPLRNSEESLDRGLTDASMPCSSVTGCCHLVSRASIEACGAFDVRFTPTQFDDLERDLRASLAGFPSRVCGSVRVRHMQHSSLNRSRTPQAKAQVFGNKIKLEHKFTGEEIRKAALANDAAVLEDLTRAFAECLASCAE